ncbi:MAG: rod shape-determining protein MreC [Blautia sp.]|nr:rod shape-determining protein MreC [Blautia sp.]
MKLFSKKKFRIKLKSKYLLAIMTLFCISCIIVTFASGISTSPLQNIAGTVIVPFEKSITKIGDVYAKSLKSLREKEDLIAENEELKKQIEVLTTQNGELLADQSELLRLQELYNLDVEYSALPKIAAEIISKDPGNWYNSFMINRGSRDGIRVNNNVIAGKGLVGIVTQVGPNWAAVRSIIDDSSNVSAMTVSTLDNCVVHGDLELIEEGKLRFEQLYDQENKVTLGERIVTSNISEKFVEGLFIGYVSEVKPDTNNLTKTGTIVTPVDFQHLKEVFVITVNKSDSMESAGEEAKLEE